MIYKTEHNAVGGFPEPGDGELLAGPSRNFQVFESLNFLAEVPQHIPDAESICSGTTDGIPTRRGASDGMQQLAGGHQRGGRSGRIGFREMLWKA